MTTTSSFSIDDFKANPDRYKKFTRARIAADLQSIPDFRLGDMVCIEYHSIVFNCAPAYKIDMPLYRVWLVGCSKEDAHVLYACALDDFRER